MKIQDKHKTLLVIVTGLAVLYLLSDKKGFLYASVAVGVLSLLSAYLGDLIVKLWYKIAEVLGWINSRILLSLVFFVFLLPFALLSRLFSKDPLKLKRQSDPSLYTDRNHTYTKADMKNVW